MVTETTATGIMEAVAHEAVVIIEISEITVIERTSIGRILTVKTGETIGMAIEITIAMSGGTITANQAGMHVMAVGTMLVMVDETIAMEDARSS